MAEAADLDAMVANAPKTLWEKDAMEVDEHGVGGAGGKILWEPK